MPQDRDAAPHRRFFVITGASGAGKSALVAELARRGFATVPEPGRRLVEGGAETPWDDPVGFAQAAIRLAVDDYEKARDLDGPVFFDRGLIDALVAHAHASGGPFLETLVRAHPYAPTVLFAPPWPDVYEQTPERRHDITEAAAEADRLAASYPSLGYRPVELPKSDVQDRADFVLARVS
jgi:predicted ATPase